MSYELNAKITLPAAMNSSQICELNVGRYQRLPFCQDDLAKARQEQPEIVSYVVSSLAQYFENQDGSEVMLTVEYFIRAV